MAFDPYYKWLGIPPTEQPPNHYRLLGISLFESDPDVIDAAANRQMGYVQGFANSDYATDSQRLLNELAAARICLLDTERRTTYDAGVGNRTALTHAAPRPKLRTFGAVSLDTTRDRRADLNTTGHPPIRSEVVQGFRVRPPRKEAIETIDTASQTTHEAADEDSRSIERPLPRIIAKRLRNSPHTSLMVTGAAILSVTVVGILIIRQLPDGHPKMVSIEAVSKSEEPVKLSTAPGVESETSNLEDTESESLQPVVPSAPAQVLNSRKLLAPIARTDQHLSRESVTSIDLLQSVRLWDAVIIGGWKFEGTSLIAAKDKGRLAVLRLPHPPWPEYVLTLEEDTIEEGLLILGLVSGDAQFSACLDWNKGKYWLQSFTNQGLHDNESTRREPRLNPKVHRMIVCKVTKQGISILIDGQLVLDWYGDYSRFNNRPLALVQIPDRSSLFLASWGVYKINKLSIEPIRTIPLDQ